jgi:hypothetical protein
MKKLVSLVIVAILFGTTVVAFLAGQTHDAQQEVQGRFVGAWRLVWLEEPDANETVHKADCTGLLVFTRDGHMSVQVMYRNPRSGGQSGPMQYAQGGYEASFGAYRIDESAHTFVFHVEGAMVRSLIGKDLPCAYELSGNQLVVKSTNPNEHWRVTWEHY